MRKKKTRREKNEELKRKYDAVKNLMSTFVMGTVAVVSVVLLVPASAKAEIIKTVSLSEEITFQVQVTDEDNSLDLTTLSVVLENQFDYYEQQISLGENSGFFAELDHNTEYRLSIYGDKGFGSERLTTKTVKTRDKDGATILSVSPLIDGHNQDYTVHVSTSNSNDLYSDITLYYGYSWEPDVELSYSSIPLYLSKETIELTDIFTTYPFHIYIMGTKDSEEVLLDEMWITPPFVFQSEIYLSYYNQSELAFYAYGNSSVSDLRYKMNVYKHDILIRTETYIPNIEFHGHEDWIIDSLKPDSNYLFECIAVFTNPQTLRTEEVTIYTEEHRTLEEYSYTYNIEKTDTYFTVTVSVNDPNDVFEYLSYEHIDTSSEFDIFINDDRFSLNQDGDNKTYTFNVDITNIEKYEIQVYLSTSTDIYIEQNIIVINNEWED